VSFFIINSEISHVASDHLNFDPVKIRGGLWVAKGDEVGGLESVFF